jgi:hypothetical protein
VRPKVCSQCAKIDKNEAGSPDSQGAINHPSGILPEREINLTTQGIALPEPDLVSAISFISGTRLL